MSLLVLQYLLNLLLFVYYFTKSLLKLLQDKILVKFFIFQTTVDPPYFRSDISCWYRHNKN